jgi:hypothetical protein
MAASDNFGPVAMSGLTEMPPPMPAETSSGSPPRFTLDHSSFEKLLAAAWVLQCLHDQLHNPHVGRDETIADQVKSQESVEPANSALQVAVVPVARLSPETDAENLPEVLISRPVNDETIADLVGAQHATKTITLDFDAAAEDELKTVEPNQSPHLDDLATIKSADAERVQRWPAFNFQSADFRAAFNRTRDAFINFRPAFRVNLTLGTLRAAAIATTVFLLAMAAGLLLVETWRHESFHSVQAISNASAPPAEASTGVTSTTLNTPNQGASEDNERTARGKPKRLSMVRPPRASHRQVTDPATVSVVRGLSRYEISGLRRQANYGDASAAFILGMAYEVGRHVPQNCVKAARWVTTAAEAGNAAAQYNLGLRYRDGDGVPVRRAESEKWLRRAAARRYSKANLALKMLASR